ncbi:TrkH family potassium uptake protein [Homoserinimonas sp. OAct 916]|uniref:TrkH family potassium uptake protein n=1 Tax=Homoserinimonas sp. OAct 916 TaxID=2211450 RepID=UPI000DBE69BB|nr:potassium transporter TrkG [Homoserinimonas sp. OAct 916]
MATRSTVPKRTRTLHRARPAQAVAVAFAAAIIVGSLLLLLPFSHAAQGHTTIIEALFTATSAVCVTGLTVVDTATHWSPFGQVVILVLIQAGGFGVMIFASMIGLVIARKLSVRTRLTAAVETKALSLGDVKGLIRGIAKISGLIEGSVALLLTLRFWLGYGHDFGQALWLGVFHAVSAFNNAGFSVVEGNLVPFVSDPFIGLPIAAAIILGGLGFPVIMQLRREFRKPLHWSMNTKLVLWMTAVLLIGGTVLIGAVEWTNPKTLGSLDDPAKVLAAFFQSVQTRTAGFNSIDIGSMHPATWLGMDVLMFIGGGPAGTAGGIKVTTFAVLFFIMYTELTGEGAVNIFGKRLSRSVHRQAITVVLLATALVVAACGSIMLLTGRDLDQVLFEVVSAFGTVGLSTGITAELPTGAHLILMVCMFVGRLGPMALGSAIALHDRRLLYEYPQERPVIG